ncbi:glycoside hydrolase family 3 protein [Cohnella mopanensis]|uniref:glycoside hydrolase family 3 protein n=1 Tax=Cohnella mopanensis TaxID=2911966 RepID=UPI001EF89359|nr:glycoside hydrolase family 3 protein [Cohnella mopanensis]
MTFKVTKGTRGKRFIHLALAACLSIPVVPAISAPGTAWAETSTSVTPITPVFSGNSKDLKTFVDDVLDHMNIDDLAYYAAQKTATEPRVTLDGTGYRLPAGAVGGSDNVHGVATDMPVTMHLGQTWNQDLMKQVGTVLGNEKRSQVGIDNANPLMFSAVADVRINPLSGRYEEGFAEDPFLTSVMADKLARGIVGDDPFYLKVQLGTKHYMTYNSEWNRNTGNYYTGVRGLNEYQLPGFSKAIESGSIQGVMSSYATMNGVPGAISPELIRAESKAPFSLFNVSDFNGDGLMVTQYGNGYDKSYVPDNDHLAGLMLLAGSHMNNSSATGAAGSPTADNYKNAVNKKLYGVTIQHLKDLVRPQIELWVRVGYFNAKNDQGLPAGYPYSGLTLDVNKVDFNTTSHQQVALQAAREGLVLLKNEGSVLPLSQNAKVAVMGQLADARLKDIYASETPKIDGSGTTPLAAIRNLIGEDQVAYDAGAKKIALKSEKTGKFVTAASGKGEQLTAGADPVAVAGTDKTYYSLTGSQGYVSENEAFQVLDWGNRAYSFKSLANNSWVTGSGDKDSASDKAKVQNDGEDMMSQSWGGGFALNMFSTNFPTYFSYETNASGQKNIRTGALPAWSFSSNVPFQNSMLTEGYYFSVNDSKAIVAGTTVDQFKTAKDAKEYAFSEVVLEEPGTKAAVLKASNDYAIVVVGAGPKIVAGEGVDRSSLALGTDQAKLVHNAAEQFPGKTIVVINSNYPLAVQDIQDDKNVAAILYASYGGQYDNKALAEALFGDYAPAGRLTGTWLQDTSSLPKLSAEQQSKVDPAYTVDMSISDPIQTKLTYLYSEEKPTYEFGYGLTYTDFKYSKLDVSSTVKSDKAFNVKFTVTNTGKMTSDEVVQLYVHARNSAYGSYAPIKQLAAFKRIKNVKPGQSVPVTLTVNPKDFAVWDVNKQDYTVEAGSYDVMVGRSSSDILLNKAVEVKGDSIAELKRNQLLNVWEHTFASKGVIGSEVSKARTAKYKGQYYAVTSTAKGDFVGIPKVNLTGAKSITMRVATTNPTGTIELRAGSPSGTLLGTASFGSTSPVSYGIGGGQTVQELGFKAVTVPLKSAKKGNQNLFLVFREGDVRVDSIQIK